MKRDRFLVRFAVLLVLVVVTAGTTARASNLDVSQIRKSNAVVLMSQQELVQTAKRLGLTFHKVKLSPAEKARLATLISNRRGSAAAYQEPGYDYVGSCFTGCLKDWGVSAVTIAGCAAVCGGGNLVGCAICAGVQEWIVLGCAQYCVWAANHVPSDPLKHQLARSQTRGARQTKLSPRLVSARS